MIIRLETDDEETYSSIETVPNKTFDPEKKLIDENVINQTSEKLAVTFLKSTNLSIEGTFYLLKRCVDSYSPLTAEIYFHLLIKNGRRRALHLKQLISITPNAIPKDLWLSFNNLLIENERKFIQEGSFATKHSEEDVVRILDLIDLSNDEATKVLRSCVKVNKDLAIKAYNKMRVNFDNKIANIDVFISRAQLILGSSVLKSMHGIIHNINQKAINLDYGIEEEKKIIEMQKQIDDSKQRLNDVIQSSNDINTQIENMNREYENVQNEIANAKENHENTINDLNNKITALQNHIEDIKLVDVEIANIKTNIDSRRQEINDKCKLIDAKRKDYIKFRNKNQEEPPNDQIEEDEEDENYISEKGRILFLFFICFGAMTIGGTMVGSSPFVNENIYSSSNLAYYIVPFFTAALETFMTLFSKENKLLLFIDKRVLLSIVHLLFIVISTLMYFVSYSKGAIIAFRSLQGLLVGLMSYILPILILQASGQDKFRIYMIVFFAFSSVGVAVFKILGTHWIKFISLVPGIQIIFIWTAHKKVFRPVNMTFKKEFILLENTNEKRNLLVLFIHIFTYQAFIGPLAFWIGIMKYNKELVHTISLSVTFLISSMIFVILLYFTREFDFGTVKNSIIFGSSASVISLIGFICLLCGKILPGFYVIAFASGFSFITFNEFCRKYEPVAIKFAFILYWILNGFSAILYIKSSIFAWSIVGIVSIVIPLIFAVIDLVKSDINIHSDKRESNDIKMFLIALGGITIGGSLVGRPLQLNYAINSWFSVCFQSLPFFTALIGTILAKFLMRSTNYLRLWLTVINVLFIIFDAIMSTVNNYPAIIVFRCFQGVLLGFLSILIPQLLQSLENWQEIYAKLFYALFNLCIAIGMFSHMLFSTNHLKYISIIPALQVFFIWYLDKSEKKIDFSDEFDEIVIPLVTAFIQAFIGNVAFLIYLTYSDDIKMYPVTYISGALLIGIICILSLKWSIKATFEEKYIPFIVMIVVSGILTLSGHVSAFMGKYHAGFYVIAFGIGMLSMIPCSLETSIYANSYYFLSFWFFNGFATVMYMKASVHSWSAVGLSFLSLTGIIPLLFLWYLIWADNRLSNRGSCGLVFIQFATCIGALTISGFMTASPLDETDRFLEQLLPFFLAAIPALIGTILIYFCSYDYDARIYVTVANILFIIFQIVLVETIDNHAVRIVFRCLQGIVVGYLSITLPIMVLSANSAHFVFYMIFFAFGIVLFKSIKGYWKNIIFIFPSLQILLIWIAEREAFKPSDKSKFDLTHLLPVFVSQIPQAFLGCFAFWMIPYDLNYNNGYLLLTFIIPMIASSIIFLILYNKLEGNLFTLLIAIFPLIFFFTSFFVAVPKLYFIIAFAIGAFSFSIPWTIFYNLNEDNELLSIPAWGSFWILNGFAYLIYSLGGRTYLYFNLVLGCLGFVALLISIGILIYIKI